MVTTARMASGLAVAALVVTAVWALPATAQDPPIVVEEPSVRSVFTDDVTVQFRLRPDGRPMNVLNVPDPSMLATARLTIQPGATFPWHTHPGPVIATVEQGELVYMYADDCEPRPYVAGTAFIDPGYGNVHTAWNPSDQDVAVVRATFLDAPTRPQDAPDGAGLTTSVASEQADDLDEGCGITTPRSR